MPRNIRATINARIVNKILEERAASGGNDSPTAQRMQDLALAAIVAGQRDAKGDITPDWRADMTFLLSGIANEAVDPADLSRLLPEDGTTEAERQKERAYVTGNGMCGTATGDAVLLNGNTTVALDQ
jgi:hypothetical protein